MNNDFNQRSRSGYRAKRRKTNLILNSLIIIVLLLIIFVAYNIFMSGNDDKAAPKKQEPKQEQKDTVDKKQENKKQNAEKKDDQAKADENKDKNQDTGNEDDGSQEASSPPQSDDSQAKSTEGGRSPNVLRTIVNPSWKPVGTSQTGEHTPVYDGVDWDEMLNAISYATGLEPGDMTVYWLGRDKSTTNASVGTVYSKSNPDQKYKVYIKWVDGEGWMPTMVEELAELEK